MFDTTAVSVRLKKTCASFIAEFFTNKQEFMRKAIENYCELSMVRVLQPQGGASINFYQGGYGVVQYYWNYYNGRQFIVITNESGIAFQNQPDKFREKIFEQLKVQKNEVIDFYIPCKADIVNANNRSMAIWRIDEFSLWDFENNSFYHREDRFTNEVIIEMLQLMNCHNSHYLLNRHAFVYEHLYNASSEWEELPSIKCKSIQRPS